MTFSSPRLGVVFLFHFLAVATTVTSAASKSLLCASCDDPLLKNDATFVHGCACDDKVTHLPGLNQPLSSAWYSGFLTYNLTGTNHTINTHYVLVQAEEMGEEELGADSEPRLLYWSNGGPGASSLFGLLTELGPYVFSELSVDTDDYEKTGIPTPIYNPYAWTRLGHVLVFDQPAPVGFSYCVNQTHPTEDCPGMEWTDEWTSLNAYLALQAFYEKFPDYKPLDLFLTGESYAGIYIPTLARRIWNDRETNEIPLRGLAVGDGCLGTETGLCGVIQDENTIDFWYLFFLAGHNQIPLKQFDKVLKACRPAEHGYHLETNITLNKECNATVHKALEQAGYVYAYALYDECFYSNGMMRQTRSRRGKKEVTTRSTWSPFTRMQSQQRPFDPLHAAVNDYACGGDVVMLDYLNLTVVKEAMHVAPDAEFFITDNAVGFTYVATEPDISPFYKEINGKLRALIYNGDTDPAITSFAAQNWTSHLGFPVLEDWRPWTVDGCLAMGGYVTRYGGSFDYLTIRGAGHMVPTIKPVAALTFLKTWLENGEYPAYVPDCTEPTIPVQATELLTSFMETVSTNYVRKG